MALDCRSRACCYVDDGDTTCVLVPEFICDDLGGAWDEDVDSCAGEPCGVCCVGPFGSEICNDTYADEAACISAAGVWYPGMAECEAGCVS